MAIIDRIVPQINFASYKEFKSDYRVNIPEGFNFAYDVVDAYAADEPDRRALVWRNDQGERREFTFAEISDLSRKAASWLAAQGVKKGDRIMLIMMRRWEYWVTAVALHRLGAVLIPASFQLTAKDIAYRVDFAEVSMLIARDDDFICTQVEKALDGRNVKKALVAGEREGWLRYGPEFPSMPPMQERIPNSNTDVMLAYFTSGTTGMPKLCVHSFTYPIGHIVTAKYWQQVEDHGLHLTASDSGWAKFGWGCIYGQWIAGTAILGYDMDAHFNARNLINVIAEEKPTTVCVPPTIYRFMMKEGLTREDFAAVHHCATAGEPLSPEVSREFENLTGLRIAEGLGQSESSVMIANFQWFDACPGSMGKPSPLYDVAIVDEDGNECAVGEEGQIVVRSLDKSVPPGLLLGYWDEGCKLRRVYDDRYGTGDVAWRDENGYYWFVGRNDDVIKCSGYRIGPFEIESVLLTHPAVHECAITGQPDPMRGQIVKATIVLSKGYEGTDELTRELQQYVKKMTAPYKYPRAVEYVEALPKTTSGKISRAQLRKTQK